VEEATKYAAMGIGLPVIIPATIAIAGGVRLRIPLMVGKKERHFTLPHFVK
jgi:hypothetical protein